MKSLDSEVDVLEINVEGAEYGIFAGTPVDALRVVRSMVVEHHAVAGHSEDEAVANSSNAGLRCVRHERHSVFDGYGTLWVERRDDIEYTDGQA